MWNVELTDLLSTTKAFLHPHDLVLTRRLNSYATCTFKVSALDESAGQLYIANRAVKLYKDSTLRFYGIISEPLTEDQDWINITAHDPFYFLGRRRLQPVVPLSQDLITYTAQDAGNGIAWDLISDQNARDVLTSHISKGTVQPSVLRTISYVVGSVISELIIQLAEMDDGFFFFIDPVDNVDGTFGSFEVRWPKSGVIQPNAVFGYGDGTVGNLAGYVKEQKLPDNVVRVLGASTLEDIATSSNSIDGYGIHDRLYSHKDIVGKTPLTTLAIANLHPTPPTTYQIAVTPQPLEIPGPPIFGVENSPDNSTFIPTLGDEFDVGDNVRTYIRRGRLDVEFTADVAEASVSISNDGNSEALSVLLTNVKDQTGGT